MRERERKRGRERREREREREKERERERYIYIYIYIIPHSVKHEKITSAYCTTCTHTLCIQCTCAYLLIMPTTLMKLSYWK